MGVARTPLIAGNWKMNLDHLQSIAFVQKLAWSLRDAKHDYSEVEVAVFPPFTDLRSVQTLIAADKLELAHGAQDVSIHDSGAYTGEISGAFLSALACRYVIIGHSERRQYHHEDDGIVAQKTVAALRHGLSPVVCVGETAEDLEAHGPSAVPVAQLRVVLEAIEADADIVVAYEPVWAIGSGQAATPEQAQQVCAALRATIAESAGGGGGRSDAHPLRRQREVGQHRRLHEPEGRRRRPRRRREPRRRRVREHRPLPEARRHRLTRPPPAVR